MSADRPAEARELVVQREVTRTALDGLAGFALAGSGAIREHGLTARPTEDVDLFTTSQDPTAFTGAVEQVTARLQGSGYTVEEIRRSAQFARLHVLSTDGLQVDVDLGVDWRQDEPVRLEVGAVLSLADAVGNKVGALYSRGEARDYLDVDAIRGSGRFSDAQLVAAAAERDAGFDLDMFAWRLDAARRVSLDDVSRYGVTADELEAVTARCSQWAVALREQPAPNTVDAAREASFSTPATEATRSRPDLTARAARQPEAGPERGTGR